MKKFLLFLCALLGTVGAWADATVTLVDGTKTNAPFDTYGTRNKGVTPNTFTSKAASGLAGVVLSAPVIDRATWWNTYCLALMPKETQTDEEVTITAPSGYKIVSISMTLRANSSSYPYIVKFNGGSTEVTGAQDFAFSKSDINATSFSFTINHKQANFDTTNKWLAVKSMTLVIGPDPAAYEAAKNAITDGETYRIKTNVGGTDYYVTTNGTLTNSKDGAGYFTITKTSGGNYGTGFRIDTGSKRFTNPPLTGNNVANLKPGNYATTDGNDRADWERQILYLNSEGKYAIRSCNVADATSSWGDAGRTHWTYYMVEDVPTPCYSYAADFIWDFEVPPVIVNVTYELYEGGTKVSSTTVKQEANSAPISPLPGTGMNYNGNFHENFCYDYAVSGTIGNTDCTITITRTEKAGVVKALSDLSNNKAYNIGCDRGAMIAYDGKMVNTALNNATANAQPYGKFALLKYDDNYYIYSIDEGKFIRNSAALSADLIADGFSAEDAIVMEAKTAPYFLWHFNADDKYLNTNGNAPLGYVINNYSTPDQGNQYYMVEADNFDPTAALAELDAYFNPSYLVTYNIKDEFGTQIATFPDIPAALGQKITTLPADYQRPYYTYNEVDVTISEQNTEIEFIATWNGPFKLSKDFDHAQWQNMAMRGTWYVTSEVKDGDGAYKTQNANTMGLVEDSYQWAFIGIGYGDGIKIINKHAGDGKSFGWTDETKTNAGIPTIMADNEGHHAWKIVASTNTSVPAGSFCLNVPGTNLYINQYGGAGGSVKFWDSGNNVGDDGSAFTVFDVPTNFASYVANEITPSMDATGYFTFTDAAKTAIGYDESKKTECSFTDYKSMKENIAAAMAEPTNFVLPETGYYLLKNKYYNTYMGIDPADKNLYGNYNPADEPKHIVKLTKTGAATYTIGLEGVFAPATVAQSQSVTAADEAGTYTVSIPTIGYAAFKADTEAQYSALHCAGGGEIVGWEAPAAASQWAALDATSVNIAISDAGYATTYLPFAVTIPGGVTAYAVSSIDANILELTAISTTIPAETPVILEGDEGTYIFAITTSDPYGETNLLTGTLTQKDAEDGSYILQNHSGDVGFYKVDTSEATPKVPANRAYLPASVSGNVKAFFFNGGTDAIKSVFSGIAEGKIFDLSGRKVAKMQKGNTYIVNGKKVNVK